MVNVHNKEYDLDDFQAYIDNTASLDAEAWRDVVVDHYACELKLSSEKLLNDKQAFMNEINTQWAPKYHEKGGEFDPEPYEQLHEMLNKPQELLCYIWVLGL